MMYPLVVIIHMFHIIIIIVMQRSPPCEWMVLGFIVLLNEVIMLSVAVGLGP